ncbi:hypothetical protein PFNF135_04734 [Plasmodium falciparum NF135/5.C10]|uniref:CTLH domain-containing protein n=1 Tax=Plasmodium falciparum NF135/5.C10 TaxID=1036726 RepID=W4ID75_PLAFA|nr:hypothetical protein PFNF135_04734 [Plasmodium falciparum NF135/5.C10]
MEEDKLTHKEKRKDIEKYTNEGDGNMNTISSNIKEEEKGSLKDDIIKFCEDNLNNEKEKNINKKMEENVEKDCCHINNRQYDNIENNPCCEEKDLNKSEEKKDIQENSYNNNNNNNNNNEYEEFIDMWINLSYTSVDNINICEKVDDLNINHKEKEKDKTKMEKFRRRQLIKDDPKEQNDDVGTSEEMDIKEDDSDSSSMEDVIISNEDEVTIEREGQRNISSDCSTQQCLDIYMRDDPKLCQDKEVDKNDKDDKDDEDEKNKKNKDKNDKNDKNDKKDKQYKQKKEQNIKGLLCLNSLDKSFIQVPLNCILNTFRNIQKEIEKNFMIITLFIEKKLKDLSDDVSIEKLNTMLEKLQALKNKVNESNFLLNKYIKRLVSRLKYIYFEGDIQVQNLKYDFRFQNYEKRINWLINEYLCRYGYFDTVSIFCKRYNLEDYSDKDVYKEYIYIINELMKYNTQPALDYCQKYKSQLKKIDSNIESELHLQYVIHLIFDNKYLEAIEYIKKTISQPHGCLASDLKFLITHIALHNKKKKKLKKFNDNRWKRVINLFKKVYSDISGLTTNPLLELLIKAGISVIKTDHCGSKTSTKCPTCIKELKNIINKLPNIQKTKSFLVCPYTNEVMDEHNPPFTTPTGYVFSEKAISLFLKAEETFECPITNEKYRMDEFSRLFI